MENSSSSKTRSPARVLAAFLAAVMLFIVMPVLPAGADGTLSEIVFLNLPRVDTNDNIIFDPNEKETNNNIVNVSNEMQPTTGPEDGPSFSWTNFTDLTRKLDSEGGVHIKSTAGFGVGGWSSVGNQFEFGLYTKNQVNVYYATSANGSWSLLSPTGSMDKKGRSCQKYAVPQDDVQGTLYIRIAQPVTATFSISGDVTVYAGMAENPGTRVYNMSAVEVLVDANNLKSDGGTLYFKAALSDANKAAGYKLNVNVSDGVSNSESAGPQLEDKKDGSYTVKKITRNITVSIEQTRDVHTVTLKAEDQDGFTVDKQISSIGFSYSVNHKDSFVFTVTTDEGREAPKVTIKKKDERGEYTISLSEKNDYNVSVNGSARTYAIYSVEDDLTVEIGAASKKTHTVTFVTGEGVSVTGISLQESDKPAENKGTMEFDAEHGSTLTFKVQAATGWKATTPVVEVNGVPIVGKNVEGVWSYSCTITTGTVITVSGFERETYTVTIKNSKEYTLDSGYNVSVPYEGSFKFTLTLTDAYETINEKITALEDNLSVDEQTAKVDIDTEDKTTYTITVSNVKKSFVLSFGGIQQKKYTVTVTAAEGSISGGYDVTNVDKQGKKEGVVHGTGVSFKITPKAGYRIENVSVYGSDSDAALASVMVNDGNGTYSIGKVTDDYTIKVRAVAVKFTITIQSTSTTTLGKDEGKTTLMGSASVTNTYTIANNSNDDAKVTYKDGYYELTLPTATRPGWKLAGWKYTSGLSVSGNTLTFTGNADQSQTVIAEWKINTDLNEAGANPFVALNIERRFESGKDVITVTHVENNIDKSDIGGTVKLLSHGILYGITKNALSGFSGMVEAGSITYADFANGNSSGSLSKFEKLTGVYFSWHKDSDKDTGNMLSDTHKFTEKVGNTKQAEGCAIGYMVVQIGNQTYLFCTRVESWEENN